MSSAARREPSLDAIVVGAGIVGAAVAATLAERGRAVLILDPAPLSGATAAGMGHVVVLEDDPATLAMTRRGRELWESYRPELPSSVEFEATGTLWIAETEDDLRLADEKRAALAAAGLTAEPVAALALKALEPNLRDGLGGGLLVREDRVLYPPSAAAWFLRRARAAGAEVRTDARVRRVVSGGVRLDDDAPISAPLVIVAAGVDSPELLPDASVPVVPRKGHLVITERHPGFCTRQIVELGYAKSAHGNADRSVAFNVQPRANGQVLIGSSRQFGAPHGGVDRDVAAEMLRRALGFLPRLAELTALRTWTGFRPSTPDKLPLIGPVPGMPGVLLATGHEGLGVTTAPFTAELILHHALGIDAAVDPRPYLPSRFSAP